MNKVQHLLIILVSLFLTSVQHVSQEEETAMRCLKMPSGKKVSPFDVMLPSGLVLKRSELSKALSNQKDQDFHIGMPESDMALFWVANDQEYLCGALLPLEQNSHVHESYYDRLISILSSKYKMICQWVSPKNKNADLLSSAQSSDLQWEKVAAINPNEKWYVCGVQKKQDVPVKYYIRKQNETAWVTKEEAFKLALLGLLEIVVLTNE